MKTKTCNNCHSEKPLSEFNSKKNSKDGLQPWCRECNKQRSRQYYADNRESHKKTILKRKHENYRKIRDRILEFKKSNPCLVCGEKEPICLDFHHVEKKKVRIAAIASTNCSLDTVEKEIKKCVILCSNCHRKLHAGIIALEALMVM